MRPDTPHAITLHFARSARRCLLAFAAAAPWLAAFGCNAVLDIDEASLCSGAACNTDAQSTREQQTILPARGALGPAEGALGGRTTSASARDAGAGDAGTEAPACVTPAADVARDCASCGGGVGCDGRCDVALPPNLGEPCGSCGGTIDCGGACSVATPSDYGSILPRDTQASFSCCLIDEVRSYGPDGLDTSGCYPGYIYDGCAVSKVSGRGTVSIEAEDAASCTCRVRVQNQGLDGATYTVHLRLKRACQPQ